MEVSFELELFNSEKKLRIFPIFHIHVINVLRQRKLVKPPVNSTHAVRHYDCSV